MHNIVAAQCVLVDTKCVKVTVKWEKGNSNRGPIMHLGLLESLQFNLHFSGLYS